MTGRQDKTSCRLAGGGAGDCTPDAATPGPSTVADLIAGIGRDYAVPIPIGGLDTSFYAQKARIEALRDAPIPSPEPVILIHPSELPEWLRIMGRKA